MNKTETPVQQQELFIVAIGASAGGLEAIHEFFDHMPDTGNMAFVIIQHLSPDYKSLLVELVSKHTSMQVQEAQHGAEVQKNCIYVIPNNKLLTIVDGRLQLIKKKPDKHPNTAIDIFMKSLAEDQGNKAIAVVLSGTGTDGTRGVEAIQQYGGMVLVQDPASAKFDGMPNSAIAAGYADFILSPALMPEEIVNYIKERPHKKLFNGKPDEQILPEILGLIEKNCGYDFHNYKTPTIIRRIARRMNQLDKKKFDEYLEHLHQNSDECKILGKEFLIGVTKFFRDTAAFDIFKNEVLEELIHGKEKQSTLKVWVTACSTGQEAYSIAILVDEILKCTGKPLEVKIFATDIDLDAIEFASKGVYPLSAVQELDPDLVNRYFTRQEDKVVIVPHIRKQIVFARHNILKDPPFIKNDIITCRNMLIYMNNALQRKVLSTLQHSLNLNGFLFLGPSEVPASINHTLIEVNGKWKIYRKTAPDRQYQPVHYDTKHSLKSREIKEPAGKDGYMARELSEEFKSLLTEEFRYAAIYIDKNYEIKEAIGDFRHYLSLPQKIVNLNVLKMVNSDMAIALNTALRKAVKENKKVTLNNVRIRENGTEKFINLHVKPAYTKEAYLMIVFSEGSDLNLVKAATDTAPFHAPESASYINELEEELKETKVHLQMVVESLETTNEELQSSNEELLSANEELQSSNEELQSLNEELHTLNTEHQQRIKELIELNDDLNNYFRSSQIGQMFVDANLRIRKFNPATAHFINLIESDIGRPIEHISNNIRDERLVREIQAVLKKGITIEKEIQLNDDTVSLMRVLPFVRQDGKTDGVVMTFYDITAVKELNNIINGVFNASLSAIMAFKCERDNRNEIIDFKWIAANHAADQFLAKNNTEYIGKSLKQEFPALLKNGFFDLLAEVVVHNKPLHTEMLLQVAGGEQWFEVLAGKMMDGLVLTLTNINEKKGAEEKLRISYHELIKTKENLRNLNASLEDKVAERTKELTESEERFRLIADATSDVVWDWNLVTNEIWWGESFYKLFGFDHSNSATETSAFWLESIHPDDREKVHESIHTAINESSKNWSAQYRFRKQDGSYAIIHDKGAVITDEQGVPYRMLGAMADVTEAERTEQKLEQKNEELQALIQEFQFVTDFMPQMVWATQPDGYHDFYNKQWFDYTGLSYDQTKDKGWSLVLHPDDYNRAWEVWRHSLQTGHNYEIEYRMRRHDGRYRWFLGRAIPLRDEAGRIIKWFGTCTDIHEQKMMNDVLEQKVKERTSALEKINNELELSNSELLQFASVASHDLKEPLRKIHMFSNLIKERYLQYSENGALDYINRIINSSARMTRLINDLLAYSRLSVNSFFELTDLNTIINEVLSDLELPIIEKGAVVEVQPLPMLEVVPGQMRQVFQNLISNALKFNAQNTAPKITITSDRVAHLSAQAEPAEEGQYCRISIKDNGIGFDEKYATKIFTIFQRLHSKDEYEGTGIGLAITKKIIEMHNGLIHANSREGEGAEFIIVLPVMQRSGGKEN